jgi:hypothetical protein
MRESLGNRHGSILPLMMANGDYQHERPISIAAVRESPLLADFVAEVGGYGLLVIDHRF